MRTKGAIAGVAMVGLGMTTACNAVTGVGDLEIGDRGPSVTARSSLIDMPGLTVKEIALYQGVKVPLMTGGMAAKSDIPIIEGRDALLRVFIETDASFSGDPVTARLFFDQDPEPIETVQNVLGNSTDDKLDSTINFDVPGDKVTVVSGYRVILGKDSGPLPKGPLAKGYPEKGFDPIPAESVGTTLKIMIAPVAYGADGSNRLPDLSDAQIQMYKDAFHSMYPAPSVEITVRSEPIAWKYQVGAGGNGWGELLDHVGTVRDQDKAPPDVYYFAPFMPTDSFGQFCGGGCVAGLGMLGQPSDTHSRAAIGLGYTGADTGVTALHEIGHNHGRNHAPCGGAQGVDPKYPHPGAQDGVWGYNLVSQQLYAPKITDIMGYCTPVWISDYTFTALAERIKFVNHARVIVPPEQQNLLYDRVMIGALGEVKWLAPARLPEPPQAEPTSLVLESDGVSEVVTGQLYRFDHLDGGILFWPAPARATKAVRLTLGGKSVRVPR
ncbi:MAG: M66 family metalloprotease [Byssovorax sp.]